MAEPRQQGSTEYIKRFSICGCLTLFMEETYAAMGMGTDLFNKKAIAGQRLVMPKISKWPKGHGPRVYKIPKRIETFMFSPFIESTAYSYSMGDGVRQSFRLRGPKLLKLGLATRVKSPSLQKWRKELVEMNERIDLMWPGINKILIFYDHSRVNSIKTQERLERWNQGALKTLGWDFLRVEFADDETKAGDEKHWGWEHYTQATREILYNKIREIEAK